jgi:hypothetical protein
MLVAGALLMACGSTDEPGADAESTVSTAPTSITAPVVEIGFATGLVAAGSGQGWVVEELSTQDFAGRRRVVHVDGNGRTTAAPDLEQLALSEVVGVDDRLVVAGSECVDGSASWSCDGRGVVRVLHDGEWETLTLEPAGGDAAANQVSIVGTAGDVVWLQVPWTEDGRRDGAMHLLELDPVAMEVTRWLDATPGVGASCLVEGVPTDHALGATVDVFRWDDAGWQAAPNGSRRADGAITDNLHCTPGGLSTSVPGQPVPVVGWTPAAGWAETAPDPRIAGAVDAPYSELVDGQPVVAIEGVAHVEASPGTWVSLGVAAPAGSVPMLAITGSTVVSCSAAGVPPDVARCEVREVVGAEK